MRKGTPWAQKGVEPSNEQNMWNKKIDMSYERYFVGILDLILFEYTNYNVTDIRSFVIFDFPRLNGVEWYPPTPTPRKKLKQRKAADLTNR